MTKIFDGKGAAENVYIGLRAEIKKLKEAGVTPKLAIFVVGDNASSKIFVRKKIEAAKTLGMEAEKHELPVNVAEDDLLEQLKRAVERVNGVIVQLPLPPRINTEKIVSAIPPDKDADGFSPFNLGKVMKGDEAIAPCSAKAVIEFFESENIGLAGKNVVIVNRSDRIGKPLSMMLLKRDATVTVCHTKTIGLAHICKNADVLIVAAGSPNLIGDGMVKEGAVVVDLGTTRYGTKIKGDTDLDGNEKISVISPVPGGIGPLTVAMAMKNTVTLTKIQNHL